MFKLLFILSSLLLSQGSYAQDEVRILNFNVLIKRSPTGYDELFVLKNNKTLSTYKLQRLDAAPKVIKIEKIKNTTDFLFIDYFKGSSGTDHIRSCFEAYIFKINTNGKINLSDKLEYKCEINSPDPAAQGDAFYKKYKIEIKNKKAAKFSLQPSE